MCDLFRMGRRSTETDSKLSCVHSFSILCQEERMTDSRTTGCGLRLCKLSGSLLTQRPRILGCGTCIIRISCHLVFRDGTTVRNKAGSQQNKLGYVWEVGVWLCTWLLHYGTHRQKSSRSPGSKHWYILHLHVCMLESGGLTLERERSVLVHLEVILKKKHEVFIQALILERWRQIKTHKWEMKHQTVWEMWTSEGEEGAWASGDMEALLWADFHNTSFRKKRDGLITNPSLICKHTQHTVGAGAILAQKRTCKDSKHDHTCLNVQNYWRKHRFTHTKGMIFFPLPN